MGLIIGLGDNKPKFPYDYYYGVKININTADPALTRIGRAELHKSLPIQSQMRRCLLDDEGQVVRYLHPTDSTKYDTGEAADLTGAKGMVMVEIPEHYRKFEFDGENIFALISTYALPGFHKVRKIYVSAYEAALDRTNNKLASVVNTTAQYRGGTNNASYDGASNSLLGMPATSISLTNFRKYARNRGEAGLNGCGWNCYLYEAALDIFWLFVIEYATLNSQAAFTSELTSEGYRQGGLGDGVIGIDWNMWSKYNGNNPFIPCGYTNSLGNATGVVAFTMPKEYDSTATTAKVVNVPSYRGIENPFAHIWKWTDGVHYRVTSDDTEGVTEFYRTIDDNPANFQDSNYNNYEKLGELSRSEGWIKRITLGEKGDIAPLEVGGSSTTYFGDGWWCSKPSSGEVLRGLLLGGYAGHGANCGLVYAYANVVPATTSAALGSRLCFIPAA